MKKKSEQLECDKATTNDNNKVKWFFSNFNKRNPAITIELNFFFFLFCNLFGLIHLIVYDVDIHTHVDIIIKVLPDKLFRNWIKWERPPLHIYLCFWWLYDQSSGELFFFLLLFTFKYLALILFFLTFIWTSF